jgi:hypothetical protein
LIEIKENVCAGTDHALETTEVGMGLFARMKRAIARAEMMESMFSRLGVRGWFAENPARAAVLRGAAMRCASCGHEGECASWLDSHETAKHAPDFCRNKELAERIRTSLAHAG